MFCSNGMILVEKFDPVKQMRTHPALINRRSNRLTIEQLKSMKVNFDDELINVILWICLAESRSYLFLLEISKTTEEKICGIAKTDWSREEIESSGISDGR